MFTLVFRLKVLRFGKLFLFSSPKSYPFWKTEIGCKDNNFPNNNKSFISKKILKLHFIWLFARLFVPLQPKN